MRERGGEQDEGEQHERFCLWQLDRRWKMLVPLYTCVEDRRTVPVSNVLICFKTIWHVESPSRSTCPGLLLFCCLCAWHCTVYVLSVSLNRFISLIRYFIYLTQPPQGMWSHPPVFFLLITLGLWDTNTLSLQVVHAIIVIWLSFVEGMSKQKSSAFTELHYISNSKERTANRECLSELFTMGLKSNTRKL